MSWSNKGDCANVNKEGSQEEDNEEDGKEDGKETHAMQGTEKDVGHAKAE